ncbi:MAG: uracil-DNA glycosylase [Patescibacteria group bacterium]|mgnify:CR=1 FL=1
MKITEEDIASAGDLSAINELVSKCERCALYKTKTKDVPGVGSENADVMFIGEAPGKDEDLQGEPFVGRAGQLLTELIEGLGRERKDVYIANVLKHRPPSNRDPLPEEAEMCWPFLKQQIKIIDPKLIIFLGRHAMNRFYPTLKISECHGKAFRKELYFEGLDSRLRGNDRGGRKQVFLALYHPAVALYNGNMKKTLQEDFSKIPKILKKINEENLNNNNEDTPTLRSGQAKIEQTKLF